MIDPEKDTELSEEGVLVDTADADEEFEMVSQANRLRRPSELEGNGTPYAGEVADQDSKKEEAAAAKEGSDGKENTQGTQGTKHGGKKAFWC